MYPKARNVKAMSAERKAALKKRVKELYPNLNFDKLFK